MSRTDEISKLDIRPEDRTPLLEQLLDVISRQNKRIEVLEAEILRLKGLPEKPRYGQPSTLEDPLGKPSVAARKNKSQKKTRGKRPGSAKRAKTAELVIHDTVPLEIGLDASGCVDPDGDALTFQWHVTTPAGEEEILHGITGQPGRGNFRHTAEGADQHVGSGAELEFEDRRYDARTI